MRPRHTLLAVVAILLLSLPTWAQPAQRPQRSTRPQAAAGPRTEARPRGQALADAIRRQMEQRKAEHAQLMAELEEIRNLARQEKAEKAAQRTQQLMDRLAARLQEQLAAMEQRLAQAEPAEQGKPAPPFKLNSFDGKTVDLAELRGKIVVLEWFNFECPFSKYHYATKPTMVELAKKYQDKDVVWLAINSTSHTQPAPNIAFAKEYSLPYPILDDRDGKVGRAYGAQTTPHMIVITPRGNIVYDGAIDNAPLGSVAGGGEPVNYVDRVLSRLTAGESVTPETTKPYGCTVKYAN